MSIALQEGYVRHKVLATVVSFHTITPERALQLFRLILENGFRLCEDLINDSDREDEKEAITLIIQEIMAADLATADGPSKTSDGWHNIRITSDKLSSLKKLMDWQLREIGVDPDSVTGACIEKEYRAEYK